MFSAKQVPPERFSREMGYAHAEFWRLLPSAAAPLTVEQGDTRALVGDGERQLIITLHPESERRIASLSVPATRVDFAFRGFSDTERQTFMRRFDLCYQRGGG